jgi:hypothetical protein
MAQHSKSPVEEVENPPASVPGQRRSDLSLVGLSIGHKKPPEAGNRTAHLAPMTVGADRAGTTQEESMVVDGHKRDYSVHTPQGWDGKTPLPVMYFFNGISPGDQDPKGYGHRSGEDG